MSRNYCFTHYDANWIPPDPLPCNYLVYQVEICPTTGREHIQGYVQMGKPIRIRALQNALAIPGAHVEAQKGTSDQARKYCMKDETRARGPYEFGVYCEKKGKRTDLDELADDILEGRTPELKHIIRYHKGIEAARNSLIEKRKWKTEVWWIHGPPGTGKSKMAAELAPDAHWKMSGPLKWWNNYHGEEDVIIDEYVYEGEDRNLLLRLMDRYPLTVETKGSCVEFAAKRLFITSNYPPPEGLEFARRIENVCEVKR